MDDERVIDYAYFYPHPVFFILHHGDEDIKDLYDAITAKGYTVYERTSVGLKNILEEAIVTNPVTSFLRPSPHPFIKRAGKRGLIVRDGSYRDEIKRWTWTCDGVTYTYSKLIPEEWYGLSALRRDITHLSTLYLCSILGIERQTSFPTNAIYHRDLQHLKKMPVTPSECSLFVKGEKSVTVCPACVVTLLDCKKFLLTSSDYRGSSPKSLKTEYVRDLMQVMGFHGFTAKGKFALTPSSLSVTLFFAPNPESGLAGDVTHTEGHVTRLFPKVIPLSEKATVTPKEVRVSPQEEESVEA